MTQEDTSTTTTTTTPRTSVAATGPTNGDQAAPVLVPAELPHTPTLPLGQLSNYAEGANNIPAGTPLSVAADPTVAQAEPAAAPLVTPAWRQIEIAAPAPLPRPGDEQLIRGTAEGAIMQEELTGQKPEMPLDPNSSEAQDQAREAWEQAQEQEKEAAESIAERQKAQQERLQAAAQEQQAQTA